MLQGFTGVRHGHYRGNTLGLIFSGVLHGCYIGITGVCQGVFILHSVTGCSMDATRIL